MRREDTPQASDIGTEDLVRRGATAPSEHNEPERDEPERDEPERDEPEHNEPERDEPERDEPERDEPARQDAHPDTDEHAALIEDADGARFRNRWHAVQEAFVDDPRRAVQDADRLVAELMQTLATTFAERKQSLEDQWRTGGDPQTEDLRLALRGYRSFFDQLLPR